MKLGKIHSLRAARRALVRVTDAVLAGDLTPRVANSAIYGLSSITRVLEVEILETRLNALEQRAELVEQRRQPARMVGHA